jgi:transcriptional regulator with XRE-family HTH domain
MRKNISGKKIKKFREDMGWGQVELSAAVNVDHGLNLEQSDISEIERGDRGVRDFELQAFASVFGVNADSLLEVADQ